MIAGDEDSIDVTIVLKNGFSHTFRMTDFSIEDHRLGRSLKWKSAPRAARLLHVEPDEIVMVFYSKAVSASPESHTEEVA